MFLLPIIRVTSAQTTLVISLVPSYFNEFPVPQYRAGVLHY